MLPGLIDGAFISATFPDAAEIALSGLDAHLLTHYFTFVNSTGFTALQQVAVSGYKPTATPGALVTQAWYDAANQSQRTDPVPNRRDVPGYSSAVWNAIVPVSLRYDPVTNPHGARPTVYDISRNIYGIDPATGFGLRTFDNVGVQYGLAALNSGAISTSQFLDLNEGVGGFDQDANYVSLRSEGDRRAIRRAYQSGAQLNGGGGLASIPILDFGAYNEDGGYHYQWHHFAVRQRLIEANGNADNHVFWRGATPNTSLAFVGAPRIIAGGPGSNSILKCQLKTVDPRDYNATFTKDEWKRLQDIFRGGVCDFSKPGVEQRSVVTWSSFGPSKDNLVWDVTRP